MCYYRGKAIRGNGNRLMSQSEICVIECDDCETKATGDSWPELHQDLRESGWKIDAVSDLCPNCA